MRAFLGPAERLVKAGPPHNGDWIEHHPGLPRTANPRVESSFERRLFDQPIGIQSLKVAIRPFALVGLDNTKARSCANRLMALASQTPQPRDEAHLSLSESNVLPWVWG